MLGYGLPGNPHWPYGVAGASTCTGRELGQAPPMAPQPGGLAAPLRVALPPHLDKLRHQHHDSPSPTPYVPMTFMEPRLTLTSRLGSELVSVRSAHSQQPVAKVQVEPLLGCHPADHLPAGGKKSRGESPSPQSSEPRVGGRAHFTGETCETGRLRQFPKVRWSWYSTVTCSVSHTIILAPRATF
jgi:hypothetical protein